LLEWRRTTLALSPLMACFPTRGVAERDVYRGRW
jgi:hypothetical protein